LAEVEKTMKYNTLKAFSNFVEFNYNPLALQQLKPYTEYREDFVQKEAII
jgi:hypothetical protein